MSAKIPELAGVAEISTALGRSRTTISTWASRRATSKFPQPVQILQMGPVYRMDEVQRWYDQHEAAALAEPVAAE